MGDAPARKTPKLPIPSQRNILITSALPYVNNVPHLGNLIGSVLSADVFARYCRLRGYNAIYICGTDEYGTATETKAKQEDCHPRDLCNKYHAIHKAVYEWFDISFDEFGRTSTPQQTQICQKIFHQLLEKNWLSESTIQQFYCDTCKRFLADRYVEGICPSTKCNYESAAGDQCGQCGKVLLKQTDLKEPKCKECRSTPLTRDTDHLFLELPLLKDRLEKYFNEMLVAGSWSEIAINETRSWMTKELRPRCITRDLEWGVHVPHDKYKDKVFYVWFDAPIGYISITSCYTPEWEKWWKDPSVELYQFMGKDNVPFHTILFPSTLIGTREDWTLSKSICATAYLNYETGKFSKSQGIGIFCNDAKDTKIPAEVWRYYLLANRPEVSDTRFSWADLQAKLKGELLDNLGNFINRVLVYIAGPKGGFNSILPHVTEEEIEKHLSTTAETERHLSTSTLVEEIVKLVKEYIEAMEKVKLKQGLKAAMSISSKGNLYLNDNKFWKKEASLPIVMKTAVGLVYLLASLLEPFMPSFSEKVLRQLNLPPRTYLSLCLENGDINQLRRPWNFLISGHRIGKPEHLFKELTNEEVEDLRNKFGGSQAVRTEQAEAAARKVAEKSKKNKKNSRTDA